MIKKILLSFALFGFVFGSPILANAQSFTNLKVQLFDLSDKLENFKKVEGNGEVLGATSTTGGYLRVSLWASKEYNIEPSDSVEVRWYVDEDIAKPTSCVGKAVNGFVNSWNGSKAFTPEGYKTQILTNITNSDILQLTCVFADNYTETSQFNLLIKADTPASTAKPEIISFISDTYDMPYIPYDLKLSWESKNATQCEWITVGGDPSAHAQWPHPLNKTLKGNQTITNVRYDTQFGLICRNEQNNSFIRKDISVNFNAKLNFQANTITVPYLGNATLSWESNMRFPDICKASGDWSGNKNYNGSQVISAIKNDKTFTLTCKHPLTGSPISKTVKVKVINPNDKDKAEVVSIPDDTKITTTTDSNTCSFTFKKALAYGSKDSKSAKDVALMQSVLVDEGLLSSKDATGVFYAKTQTALKNFQKRYNLSQTGKLDTKTADKMNTLFAQYCAN